MGFIAAIAAGTAAKSSMSSGSDFMSQASSLTDSAVKAGETAGSALDFAKTDTGKMLQESSETAIGKFPGGVDLSEETQAATADQSNFFATAWENAKKSIGADGNATPQQNMYNLTKTVVSRSKSEDPDMQSIPAQSAQQIPEAQAANAEDELNRLRNRMNND